jgi:hypothetical protein
MKKIILFLFMVFLAISKTSAQEEGFYLEVSKDTILSGNVLQISFIANNVSGQFEAPDLEGLNVISGPNSASSMSMINGTITQRASYSFGIYMEDIGEVIIPPAYLITKEGTLETEPRSIMILPNPEGIIDETPTESGFFQFSFPGQSDYKKQEKENNLPTKKKRKLKKI